MRKLTCLLTFILFATAATGFAQIKKANKLYNLYDYSQAIPYYLKAVKSKKKETQKEATFKLAESYRMVNNASEARSWYKRSLQYNDVAPINYFYLGQAARTLQEYKDAEQAFRKYAALVPDDLRGELYAGYCALMEDWEELEPSAEVKNTKNINSKYADFGPAFYKDGVVFASDRNPSLIEEHRYGWTNYNYLNLYMSTPKYFEDFWGDMGSPAAMSSQFNQSFHDGPAFFTQDNNKMFLTRTNKKSGDKGEEGIITFLLKIFYTVIKDGKTEFKAFPYNSEQYSVGHPTVSADGNTMIFVSDMSGSTGGTDLYKSIFTDGSWSTPVNLGETLNTIGNEGFPTLVNDTLLYFSSDGHPGYGGQDIFVSHMIEGEWSGPQNLYAPINSSYDDFSIAVSSDLSSGFFSSNRPGGLGSDDIYAFRNAKPSVKAIPVIAKAKISPLSMKGFVKDKTSGKPLGGAMVFVLNTKTNKVKVLETGTDGIFTLPAEKDVLYISKAVKPDYMDDCLNFRIMEADTSAIYDVPRPLMLDKLEVNKSFRVENIYYDLDKWFIREDAKPALDNLVEIMKKYPITAELSSHTDSRASNAYNDELSQKRAEAAVRYIVLQGVDPSRLVAKGYGETRLVNKCSDGVSCTEDEHQQNRRTEFKILSIEKRIDDPDFNPNVFKAGDEVDVYLFDPDFFRNCMGEKKPSAEQSENIKSQLPSNIDAFSEGGKVAEPFAFCYGVQIAAVGKNLPVNDPWFKGIHQIKIYSSGKLNKYVAGCETDKSQAESLLSSIKGKGFREAFIVKIEGDNITSAK
jgi:outer membrane protein OmpA-like peptidoglycan-associated protein